jgi:heptosyltransferase-2
MWQQVIVRLPNWLGDTVMAVPAIRALRGSLAGARMLLAGPWAPLLADQGLADLLVTYPRSWSGRLGTADRMREFGGDLVLVLPNSFEAALAARYWRARTRVGFATQGRASLLTDAPPLPAPRRHQTDEYLVLVEALAIAAVARIPDLHPPAPDSPVRQRVRQLLDEAGAGRRPRIGIHVGASYGTAKVWPAGRTADLCQLLRARGITGVLLGTGADEAHAAAVLGRAPGPSLVGRDSPDLLPALLAELDGLLCGDTGVGHLAAALGTPVVALFGPTDPARTAPRGPVTVITHAVPCAPCFYRSCPIDHPCLRGIEPGEVVAALGRWLDGQAGS